MVDLIGFLAVVTLHIVLLLNLFVVIVYKMVCMFVDYVVESKGFTRHRILRHMEVKTGKHYYTCGSYLDLFLGYTFLTGLFAWFVMFIVTDLRKISLIDAIIFDANTIGPYVSVPVLIVIGLTLLAMIGRKCFRLYTKLK